MAYDRAAPHQQRPFSTQHFERNTLKTSSIHEPTTLRHVQAFSTNTGKKRCVIIYAENFKQDMVSQDNVFPFGHWGARNSWDNDFLFRHKGLNTDFTQMGFYTRKLKRYIIIACTCFPAKWKMWSGNCLLQNSRFLYVSKYGIFGAYLNSYLKYLHLLQCILKLIFYNSL